MGTCRLNRGSAGQASFGFTFTCENGDLKIELAYNDKGANPLGSSFGIKGTVDTVDPVLESQFCIGQNPPPPPENQLIFLGRYRLIAGPPGIFQYRPARRRRPRRYAASR